MIGRAYLWGLAANGQAGVENVLDVLRGGIDSALLGLGRRLDRRADPEHAAGARGLPPRARRDRPVGIDAACWPDAPPAAEAVEVAGWCWCRSGRSSSTARTCRSTPTPRSPMAVATRRRPSGSVAGRPGSRRRSPTASSGEHQSFAGTSSIGTDGLRPVLVELVRSLRTWAGAGRPRQRPRRQPRRAASAVDAARGRGSRRVLGPLRDRGGGRRTPAAPRPR